MASDFEVCHLLQKLNHSYSDHIEKQIFIRALIDNFFETTKGFYGTFLLMYMLFVIPILLQFYYARKAGTIICIAIAASVQCVLIYIEVIQVKDLGIRKYLRSRYNWNDMIQSITFVFYFIFRLND